MFTNHIYIYICVTNWPSTQLSINNRCIRSKISGYHLDLWTGWIRCNCDAHRKQVTSNNYITGCYRRLELVGVCWLEFESQFEAVRTSSRQRVCGPQLSSPAEWERSAAIVRGTWGQYVAVCSVSNSPLTHNLFATLSRIKCERYIFLKNCVRSSL